ncbi:LysR family transcriptional regulator [Myxococcaceae bacterium JPH2]|nr:LysR family transcriptional regulator [Myxococcaceae bacterium JPH2]
MLEQLEAFLAVVEEEGITAAAKRLHLSQPTLSRQLRGLEKSLGAQLVVRTARGVALTEAGRRYLTFARQAVDNLRAGAAAVAEVTERPQGTVALGVMASVTAQVAPAMVAAFHARFPHVVVRLTEGLPDVLEAQLARGMLDLAVLNLPLKRVDLVIQRLWDEDFVLLAPRGHPLGRATAPIALGDACGEPFVIVPEAPATEALRRACAERGQSLRVVAETDTVESLRRLVEAGLGVAFVPALLARQPGNFEVVPVGAGGRHREVVLVHRGNASLKSAARALKQHIVETMHGPGRP